MQIFDSHCHVDDKSFDSDLGAVIQRARAADVNALMIAGINLETSHKAIHIAKTNTDIYASVGVHPHDVKNCTAEIIKRLTQLAQEPEVRAWGEIGLDYNRMYSPEKLQEKWFIEQLRTADELELPLIFHERESQGRFVELLDMHPNPKRKAVVHCFSGNETELRRYIEMGFYIGITGIVTIEKRGHQLRQLIPTIPVDRIVVETDAPYLTPAPQKNKTRRNEPAFVRSVLMAVAKAREEDPEALADTIWQNTCRLFNLAI